MRALVLSGGGARGAYQAGAIKHLLGDLKIQYHIITGISVGAINGAYIAGYPIGKEVECSNDLINVWNNIRQDDIYINWKPLGPIHAIKKGSIYNRSPLKKLIKRNFNHQKVKESGKKLRIGAMCLTDGKYKIFDENYVDLVTAILASSSLPLVFPPVELEGKKWVDGGLKKLIPIREAIDAGATKIDIVSSSPEYLQQAASIDNIFNIGFRTIEIMAERVSAKRLKNKRINKIIRPNSPITNNSFNFAQWNIQQMMRRGYEDACKIMNS
jgi:NTE family protein